MTIVKCPEFQCQWNKDGICNKKELELTDTHDTACCLEEEGKE